MNISHHYQSTPGDILVVDDTPANLKVLQELLIADGHQVRAARDAQSALRAIARNAPELVLLDVMMPEMDGFELCQQLKRNATTQSIPVIFITALNSPADKARAFEVGGADYIPKPFHPLEVCARVRHHLGHRRTQVALESSEQQMRAIFAAMTDLVVIRDRQGHCLKVAPTQATQELASEQELLSSPLEALVSSADVEPLQHAIQAALDQQRTQKIQYQRLNTNHKTWFDARLSPLTADTVVWVARDISDHKTIEQKLQRNEQEMRRIFEAMSDLVLAITPTHQDIQVMPTRYVQVVDTAHEVITATFEKIFGEIAQPRFHAIIAQVLETQIPQSLEYCVQTENGRFWFSVSISVLSEDTVLWVARDISDRIIAEQELQRLANELEQRVNERTAQLQAVNTDLRNEINERRLAQTRWEQSELRFHVAVDNLPDLFVIYDRNLCYQFVNQRTVKILGRTAGEMLGQSDVELFPPAICREYLPLLEQTAQTAQIQSRECYIIVPEQGLMTFVVTYVPLLNNKGQLEQILGIAHDITERKRSEQALNHAKEQLQTVIDAVPGFVSWIGTLNNVEEVQAQPQFYYLGVNRQLAQTYQLSPKDFIGQPLGFLNLGDQFVQFLQQLFTQSEIKTHSEVISTSLQGETRSYLVMAQKYNSATAAVTVGIDISDRIEMEKRLQQSYERSQLLSELTLKVRQSLEIDEIVYTTVWELQHLLHADRVALIQFPDAGQSQVIQEVGLPGLSRLQAGNSHLLMTNTELEIHDFIAIDDTWTAANISHEEAQAYEKFEIRAQLVVPIFIQQTLWGAVVAHQCNHPRHWESEEIDLLLSLADQIGIALTQAQLLNNLEERVAERTLELRKEVAERTRAEKALRTSQIQFQRIIHSSTYGIVICNTHGEIQFANPAALKLFGRSSSELLGFNLGIPIEHQEQTEISLLPANGNASRTVEMRSGRIHWQEQPAYLISLMDITERKMIDQMKDEFLSIASHELRTPLTSIRGALGLLVSGKLGKFTEQGQNMVEIAVNNTERLMRLLDDILDLERIEAGRITIAKQRCNAIDLILQSAQAMEAFAAEQKITLSLEANQQLFSCISTLKEPQSWTAPPQITTWADTDQILRTLLNLISNAIKFSEPGQSVWVGVEQMPDSVQFYVRDRGRGIPADKLESIFGRFQQVDASDSREKGGTGLGLAICQEIVRHHGGKIWVDSVLGRGSTFCFLLPNQVP
ncbi:MAG: PAS domain S-box protein [Spirulina sp. SIO3F2]|nr:PAS domain S-box protein [Spirulina sp. SIO3F2]